MAIDMLAAGCSIACKPANVELAGYEAGTNQAPASDGRRYDLNSDWDWIKAAGLAAGYAVPFLSGERSDVVRARLVGKTCINFPLPAMLIVRQNVSLGDSRDTPPTHDVSVASVKAGPTVDSGVSPSARCQQVLKLNVSPHGLAMMFSSIQFLWILVAANLPAIARRRP